jgi:hypothetical protein
MVRSEKTKQHVLDDKLRQQPSYLLTIYMNIYVYDEAKTIQGKMS